MKDYSMRLVISSIFVEIYSNVRKSEKTYCMISTRFNLHDEKIIWNQNYALCASLEVPPESFSKWDEMLSIDIDAWKIIWIYDILVSIFVSIHSILILVYLDVRLISDSICRPQSNWDNVDNSIHLRKAVKNINA